MFKRILMFMAVILMATSAFAFDFKPKSYFVGGELVQSMPGKADFNSIKLHDTGHFLWWKLNDNILLFGKDPHLGRSMAGGFIVGAKWTDLVDTTISYHFGRRYHMQSHWSDEDNRPGKEKEIGNLNAILENNTVFFNIILNARGVPGFDLGKWEPFVGGGVGIAINRLANVHGPGLIAIADNEVIKFAWQAMGGIRYHFTDKFNVEAGYRFVHFGDFVSGDNWNALIDGKLNPSSISMKGKLWAQEIFMTFIYSFC